MVRPYVYINRDGVDSDGVDRRHIHAMECDGCWQRAWMADRGLAVEPGRALGHKPDCLVMLARAIEEVCGG